MINEKNAYVIVISSKGNHILNAMITANLAIELAEENFNVAVFDSHSNDGSLVEFIQRRQQYINKHKSQIYNLENFNQSYLSVDNFITHEYNGHDVIVISSPSDLNDYKSAFFYAQTLVTILDDKTSLSLLSEPEPSKKTLLQSSAYTNFVWEIKKHMAVQEKSTLNWAVLPYQQEETVTKQKNFLLEIAKRYGFRISSEIFPREIVQTLFDQGLSLFDLNHDNLHKFMDLQWLGAKREFRNFAEFVLNSQHK